MGSRNLIRGERGFALPLTIFVLVLVTLLLAGAFVRVSTERRVSESGADMVDALTIAQSGIYQYLDYRTGLNVRPPDGDSVFFASIPPGGTASVRADVVHLPADPAKPTLYLITAIGQRIDPGVGAEPRAVRTVTQLAHWHSGVIRPAAALLAYRAVDTPGDTAGVVITDGFDGSGCGMPSIPDRDENGVGGGNAGLMSTVGIDWRTIATNGYQADYNSLTNLGDWTSYLIDGDLTLDRDGKGLLVVTGTLITEGSAVDWDGVVLVGDSAVFSANTTTVRGALVTGLNDVLIGAPPGRPTVEPSNTLEVYYHSCNVDSAMTSVRGFAALANTWLDRWMAD